MEQCLFIINMTFYQGILVQEGDCMAEQSKWNPQMQGPNYRVASVYSQQHLQDAILCPQVNLQEN